MLVPERRAFSVPELLVALALFAMLSALLWGFLQSTAQIWRRTSSRDGALRQILKARAALTRDLANASKKTTQFATAKTGPSLAAGFDGDALTILSCDNGVTPWNITATGSSVFTSEVTYALFVPQNVNSLYPYTFVGGADSDGYEQTCPCKWLVRRHDAAPAAVAPAEPTIPAGWATTFLHRPASLAGTGNEQIVASQLLGFRVLGTGAVWQIELKAVATEDAGRQIRVGSAPLGSSTFTLVQRFTVTGHN